MILVITGNGKGKTTSAIGTAIRSVGWGNKTAIVFFDKGGPHYGEQKAFELLKGSDLEIYRFGQKRFDEKENIFRFENTDDDIKEANFALKQAKELYSKKYFLIICDEIINALNLDLLDELDVLDLVNECPKDTHLVLTGRNAPKWLIDKADLVSEINEVKHYFKKGEQPIKGLDY